jgi:hypothetical protein
MVILKNNNIHAGAALFQQFEAFLPTETISQMGIDHLCYSHAQWTRKQNDVTKDIIISNNNQARKTGNKETHKTLVSKK